VPKLPAPPLPAPLKAPPPRPGDGNGKTGVAEEAKAAGINVVDWVDERTSLSGGARWLMFRKVPKGTNWFYTLGSATMFAFLSQAVTGVFLAMYYRPDASGGAYESIRYVTNDVFLGQFVRGMHKWGSSVMVVLVFLHMARTFFFGAYKYPRELNWVIGVVLLILTMVMSFTGYLLPFDQRAYWATIVGVNINGRAIPELFPLSRPLFGGHHALALLRDPHAAHPRRADRADQCPSLPGGEARYDRAAVDKGRDNPRAARGGRIAMTICLHRPARPAARRTPQSRMLAR
jgi:menaquinol-cytochrome c reductase cytochrome b subunit